MNIIQIIIISATIIYFSLDLISGYLNLKSLKKEVPEDFKNILDEGKYKISQEYYRANHRLELISNSFDLAVFFTFWFSGGFNYLDKILRSIELSEITSGLIYIGALIFAKFILDIPFSIYQTFVLEENFNFNTTTPSLFIKDRIKGIIIGLILGIPVISLILFFFMHFKVHGWLYCWVTLSIFILFMQVVFPSFIMPLFNKFSPLEDGELKERVFSYAKENNFPLKNVFVMDGSKRSRKSNAFFTGFGKTKRLVLFDNLIKNHTTDELIAILAHETGHYKRHHMAIQTATGIVQSGIMFFLLSFFISYKPLFDAFYMEHSSVYAGIVFFGMLYSPMEFFLGFMTLVISRKNELEADRFAAETTGMGKELINALKKLSVDNYSNLTPHPFHVFLNYSHPPVLERIRKIKAI